MPTPPFVIPIPAPVAPISTPAVTLPCGVKVPSIPLIPDLSFSIKIPSFNLFPSKAAKKGAKPSRKASKLLAWAQALAALCNSNLPVPRT